jgi:copper chaperone CopZ
MKQIFKIENVKCGGCANTLKKKLFDKFGDIDVNLDAMPREITVEISDDSIDDLRSALISLGYPMSDEELGVLDGVKTKAKSFVSCAIGKIDI